MTPAVFGIAVGTFGAVLQELLFWYNAKDKLESQEYRAIIASAKYWIVVSAMAVGSGIAAYLWFSPDQQAARTYLLVGAAFPVLFKKSVDAFIRSPGTPLGATAEEKQRDAKKKILKNYFKAS
jgi:hypothetical protein